MADSLFNLGGGTTINPQALGTVGTAGGVMAGIGGIVGLMGQQQQSKAIGSIQQAANAIASVLPPNLVQYAMPLAQMVFQGQINVADVQAAIQQDSVANGIQPDTQALQAQREALSQLQMMGTQGYTPTERAQITQMLNQVNQQEAGQQAGIVQQMQQRGQWGTGQELASRLISQQGAANIAAQQGMSLEAAARQNALQAIAQGGQLGGQIQSNLFNQQMQKAQAQNAINQFNAQLQQQAGMQNAQMQNQAALTAQQQQYQVQQQNIANQQFTQQQRLNAANQQWANQAQQLGMMSGLETQAANLGYGQGTQMYQTGMNMAGAGANAYMGSKLLGGMQQPTTTALATPNFNMPTNYVSTNPNYNPYQLAHGAIDLQGPGTTKSDSIPAMLSKHEAVLTAEAADRLGRDNIKKLNQGTMDTGELEKVLHHLAGGAIDIPAVEHAVPAAEVQVAVPKGGPIDEKEALELALRALQAKEKQ